MLQPTRASDGDGAASGAAPGSASFGYIHTIVYCSALYSVITYATTSYSIQLHNIISYNIL